MSMQILLEALPPPGEGKTVAELSKATGIDRKNVAKSCTKLMNRGLVIRPKLGTYRLSDNGLEVRSSGHKFTSGPKGPTLKHRPKNKKTIRSKVWTCLRNTGGAITVPEIQALIEGGSYTNIQHYLRDLTQAGYVAKLARRVPGTAPTSSGSGQYLLVKNTGPLAPTIYQGKKVIFDGNTDETIALGGAS